MFKTKKSTEVMIEEIHNTFNTAGEKLLASALEILNQVGTPTMEKAERLKRVGFFNANEVKKIEGVKLTMQLAESIGYYQKKYPNNKFLTEEQVKTICKKYSLVCAPIDRYNGFVPETKLSLIENFKVAKEDKNVFQVKIKEAWNTGGNDLFSKKRGASHLHKILGLKLIPANHPQLYWRGDGRLFGVKGLNTGIGYVEKYDIIGNDSLMICAPKKDIALKGLTKFGYIFKSLTTVEVPDPVVLQPVNGGYLIVCAWGDEASDDLVVNQTHN